MNNKFYVYLHRRKTDNKVFYVGKGKGKRAYTKRGRNIRWINIANKYGFSVEIAFDNLTEEDAFAIEIDTIKEMRHMFHETLCNMTDGGEGASGLKWTAEQRMKIEGRIQGKDEIENRRSKLIGKKMSPVDIARIKKLQEPRYISMRVFVFIKKTLLHKPIIPYIRLSEITNLPLEDLCRSGKLSASAIAKSVKTRSKKPSWNSGKKLPEFSGENNSCSDKTIYNFIRVTDGEKFTGTRYELSDKYNLNLQQLGKLFYTRPRKVSLGWSLLKEENGTNSKDKA